jgi:hypothetical protein
MEPRRPEDRTMTKALMNALTVAAARDHLLTALSMDIEAAPAVDIFDEVEEWAFGVAAEHGVDVDDDAIANRIDGRVAGIVNALL